MKPYSTTMNDKDNNEILKDSKKGTLNMLAFINRTLETETTTFQSKLEVSQLLVNYIRAVRS